VPGAYPQASLTLTITPPGGSPTNYSTYLAYAGTSQQFTITQNFGRQGDTATIPLVDDWAGLSSPHFYIPVESQISLYDNNAAVNLFAGVITAPSLVVTGPNRNEWALACTDYTYYADNTIVHGTYNGLSIDQIVVAATLQGNCGISARTPAGGGFVSPAPVLTQVNLPYQTLSSAWRSLAQLASSSTPYGWYVDQNRALHFFDATTAQSSGVTFTTAPTAAGGGSYTEGHIALDGQFSYIWDGTSIRNKVLVQGASQTVSANLNGNATDVWRGDGVQTSWPLRYTVTGSPSLYINGVSTSVTVASGGSPVGNAAWSIQQNSFGQWFLIAADAPGDGWYIQIWYSYQVPVIAQASDAASQAEYTGPNGGVFTEYISDSSLSTASMALARAMREKTEYAFAAERVTFTVTEEFFGWVRAGQTFQMTNSLVPDSRNSYAWGITNATFLCIANSVTFGTGGYRRMQISGVRL
jgi:hypothetical protein